MRFLRAETRSVPCLHTLPNSVPNSSARLGASALSNCGSQASKMDPAYSHLVFRSPLTLDRADPGTNKIMWK